MERNIKLTGDKMDGEEAANLAKSIMPIGLPILRSIRKTDLIVIILNREIAFNNLRVEYLKLLKDDFKNSFEFARINLGLTYTQEELLGKNLFMINQIKNLKEELSSLRSELSSLRRRHNYG
jgi:hypothetical protein